MTDADLPDRDDDSLLAAEYVLRLLEREEERAFEARLERDSALMREVNAWSERLSGMDAEFAAETPRAAIKAHLMERLFGAPERTTSIWQKLSLWQGLSFASLLVAGFFAWQVTQLAPVDTPASGPLYVSEIAAEDQSLRVLAVYDSDSDALQINRTAGQAAAGRTLELWVITDGNAPVSLGVLPDAQTTEITLPEEFRAQVADLTLAISDEPPGGSPTGQPTGAVLAVGTVTEL
ncbi:anti-sigma factor [uncultured Roseovarius sp.]|uniref:anti-sigma factor n=1 Tax=uncultured Roseovarius sp. TaxID=293344 RepID=UPI002616CB3A|nr:anti-sigma factor [uncultured Roseovarius sp.]